MTCVEARAVAPASAARDDVERPPAVAVPLGALDDAAQRDLLARIAAGDQQAMRLFSGAYGPRLARFLRSVTSRADLIDEIVNDTLFHVWRSARRFRGESRVSTWVLGIARRRGMKHARREWQH